MEVYSPPQNDSAIRVERPMRLLLGKVLSVLSLLMLFSAVGLAQTLLSLYEVFQVVTIEGTGDPKVMAGYISQSLVPMVFSLMIALPGVLFALVAIFTSSYRSRLIFKLWVFSSVALIFSVPFGSAFGLVFALVIFLKRAEFKKVT